MKSFFINKIIPILSIFCIIGSLFVFPSSAITNPDKELEAYLQKLPVDQLTWVPLDPGTGFAYFELYNTDLYKKTASPKKGDYSDTYAYMYNFHSSTSSTKFKFYNVFFNINIANPGYKLKKGVNYYISMELVFPKKYGPNEDLGYVWWPYECTAGAYTWQSVAYSDRNNFTFQYDNVTMLKYQNTIQDDLYQTKLPACTNIFKSAGNNDTLTLMQYYCKIIPSQDMYLKSMGFNLAFTEANVWDGIIGVTDFHIGVPNNLVEFDTSGNVFGDYTGQNNTSSNTTSGNTSSNTSSSNTSSGTPSTGPGGTPSNGGSGTPSYGPGGTPSFSPNASGVASNTFGGDVFTTVGGLEGGIAGNNKNNMNSLFGVFEGFGNSLSGSNGLTKGLTVASNILSQSLNIPSFSSILYFSLALGFIAFSLNLISTFVSSSNKKAVNKVKQSIKNKNSAAKKPKGG